MEKKCLYCGQPYMDSRSDQKFCCLLCKDKYNYAISASNKRMRNRIITDLNSNYDILLKLLRQDIRSISLTDPLMIGFNQSLMTSFRKGNGSFVEYACFDIIYRITEMRIINIRQGNLL